MIGVGELILLDTNIALRLLRGDTLGRRIEADYELLARSDAPLISVVTVGELLAFARRRRYASEKMRRLNELIASLVVLDVEHEIAECFAEILAGQQAIGKPIGENDTWLAATAMVTGATLLTTDRDFAKLTVGLIKVEIVDVDDRFSGGDPGQAVEAE